MPAEERTPRPAGPLATLREYRALAPWKLDELAAVAGGILAATAVAGPDAARARPTGRTIRFYVSRGLVSPPEGRGAGATYVYRHLLEVLAVRLRQAEGAALDSVAAELESLTGDAIERRVAAALGHRLPSPDQLPLPLPNPWGPVEAAAVATTCRRIPVAPGIEVLIDDQHPAVRLGRDLGAVAEAVRRALAALVHPDSPAEEPS